MVLTSSLWCEPFGRSTKKKMRTRRWTQRLPASRLLLLRYAQGRSRATGSRESPWTLGGLGGSRGNFGVRAPSDVNGQTAVEEGAGCNWRRGNFGARAPSDVNGQTAVEEGAGCNWRRVADERAVRGSGSDLPAPNHAASALLLPRSRIPFRVFRVFRGSGLPVGPLPLSSAACNHRRSRPLAPR